MRPARSHSGNAGDTVKDFTIENVSLKAKSDTLRCNYPGVRLADFTVNGHAPVVLPADEAMKAALNYDAGDLGNQSSPRRVP